MAKKKVTKKTVKKRAQPGAEERFVDNLIIRGEAVKKTGGKQKLPPGATHWIVENKDEKAITVKRGRFSLI
jgi:hypothetical protein